MANSVTSSDSGGGVPLHSPRPHEATPRQEDKEPSKSDSPTDDEMALVRASSHFNQISHDNFSPRPEVIHTNNHRGPHIARPHTARPPTAFQQQMPFTNNSHPYRPDRALPAPPTPHPAVLSSNPLYNGFGDIQAQLVTAQQYVRISPGFTSELAGNIQGLLLSIGQDLTHFTTTLVQEHTKSQHQAGELRVQLEKAQQELLSRRQQISDIQEQYKSLNKEKEFQEKEISSLKKRLDSYEGEIKRLQRLTKNYDEKHLKQVQALEDEIKVLRLSPGTPTQLIKASNSSSTRKVSFQTSGTDEDDATGSEIYSPTDQVHRSSRRRSSLNPTAPEFGPRSTKPEHSNELLPLLLKYKNVNSGTPKSSPQQSSFNGSTRPDKPLTPLAMKPNNGRPIRPQDARAYHGNDAPARPERRPETSYGFRRDSSTSGYSSGPNGAMLAPRPSHAVYSSAMHRHSEMDSRIPREKEDWNDEDVTTAFHRLYEVVEGIIATQHCEGPFNDNDNMLPVAHPMTWNYILSMGLENRAQSASHMATLLSKIDCRHFVIKRVIIDYIFHRMIAPEVFYGFSDEIDGHLRALQERMRSRLPGTNAGRPQGKQRQRIIEDHAKVIQFIVNSSDGKKFRSDLIAKHSEMLHDILKPMRSCVIDDDKARKALAIAINAAWVITSKIWTSGMTLHFFFPETGTKFSFGTMRPMNHHNVAAEQMQYSQFRVMLIITPTLSLRDDRDLESLRTHELMKADVLVMK
ncbi:hypothetical protein BJ170DRAFT_710823 [Xylariales sp. AK1849]|nr:hypothetical protein BJ170DRAFT_710823 [Xylariales sp. AK1849]